MGFDSLGERPGFASGPRCGVGGRQLDEKEKGIQDQRNENVSRR